MGYARAAEGWKITLGPDHPQTIQTAMILARLRSGGHGEVTGDSTDGVKERLAISDAGPRREQPSSVANVRSRSQEARLASSNADPRREQVNKAAAASSGSQEAF